MTAELWRAILISCFGRRSAKPLRSSIFKLAIAASTSLAVGLYLSRALLKTRLAQDLPDIWAASFISLAGFTFIGLIMLIFAQAKGIDRLPGEVNLGVISKAWPLSRKTTWTISVIPQSLVWTVLMIGSSWLTVTASHLADLSVAKMLLAFFGGSLAALALALWNQLGGWRSVIFLAVSGLGIYSLVLALRSTRAIYAGAAFIVEAFICLGYLYSQLFTSDNHRSSRTRYFKLPLLTLPQSWFLLKILRHSRTLTSLIFGLVLSSALAAVSYWRHTGLANGGGLLFCAALISLGFSADIRGISRYFKAQETNGLKGFVYFSRHQLVSTWLICLLITSPLLLVDLISGYHISLITLVNWLCLEALAVSCGLLGSTWLVPQNGEFGSQFLAAAAGTGAFIAWTKISSNYLMWLVGGLTGVLIMYLTEVVRSKNYGHARAEP